MFQISNYQGIIPDVWFGINGTTGNVGIGTVTPMEKLHVEGNTLINSAVGKLLLKDLTTGVGWGLGTANNGNMFQISNYQGIIPDVWFGINGTTGNVGIGTVSPSEKLQVEGSTMINSSAGDLILRDIPANNGWHIGTINNGTSVVVFPEDPMPTGPYIYYANVTTGFTGISNNNPTSELDVAGKTTTTSLKVTAGAANGSVLTSDASGNASWDSKVAFAGKMSGSQSIPGTVTPTTVVFDNELHDYGSNYNPATGIFTAPSAGVYHFDATIKWGFSVSSGVVTMRLMVNTNEYMRVEDGIMSSSYPLTQQFSTDVLLAAGNQVKIEAILNTGSAQNILGFNTYCIFSAHKIR